MKKQIFIIAVVLVIVAYLTYRWIISLPPTAIQDSGPVTIQRGEEIFWGKGTCHACHRIGSRGYALRGPNLGESNDGEILPRRAGARAQELKLETALDYIVQSVTQPGAFVAPGFSNEMPEPFRPPIGLSPSEMKSIIFYLATLDGDSVNPAIELPQAVLTYYGRPQSSKFKIAGDPIAGRALFFDPDRAAACSACHVARDVDGEKTGGTMGPDLSAIGSFRTPEYILQKIVNPDSNMVSGYKTVLITLKQGQMVTGLLLEQNAQRILIEESDGTTRLLLQRKINQITVQKKSLMPGNYGDLLTNEQLHDLTAFLSSQINAADDASLEE